jgi:hypothetical protein
MASQLWIATERHAHGELSLQKLTWPRIC